MAGVGVDVIHVLLGEYVGLANVSLKVAGTVQTGFPTNEKVLDMRLTTSVESVYAHDCSDKIWAAEIEITERTLAASTAKYSAEKSARDIVRALHGSPSLIVTG